MYLVAFRLSIWLLILYFSGISAIIVNNSSICTDSRAEGSLKLKIAKGTQRGGRNERICGYISPSVTNRSFCNGDLVAGGEYRTVNTEKSHFNGGLDSRDPSVAFCANFETNRRNLACSLFFGTQTSIYTDALWEHELETDKKYEKKRKKTTKTEASESLEPPQDQTSTSDVESKLPLAPPYEDEPLETIKETTDLTKPPSFKNEWTLKRIAHGRDFWHRFCENPSEHGQRAHRWIKFTHDRFFCNRILKRTYTEVHPLKTGKLSKKDQRRQKSRIRITREIIGYDNSSETSNLVILLNYPQERLVKLVEVMRLPGILDLRNYEMLGLLRFSLIYLSKLKGFRSLVEFLLSFGRLNICDAADCEKVPVAESTDEPQEANGKRKYGPIKTIFREGNRVMRPLIFAKIGRFRKDPFPEHLLIPRRAKEKPIREPFPINEHVCSLNKFLDKCQEFMRKKLETATYNYDETMDRTFSDIFTDAPEYTTYQSVNKIDYPTTFEFLDNLKELFIPEESNDNSKAEHSETDNGNIHSSYKWTAQDIKYMLTRIKGFGLTSLETIIKRFRALHNEIGFTYDEIIRIGKKSPMVFATGNYKHRCLQIYDLDEAFTHEMVLQIVRSNPVLLGVNISRSIRPKVFYLTRSLCQPVSMLLDFPKFLSYSLYDRIIPRHIALMNKYYNGEFLKVYNYLFESGYYHAYGQMVTDEKVPNILPEGHAEHLGAYKTLINQVPIKKMVTLSDPLFCEEFGITYRGLVEGKVQAMKIRLPCDMF
ncbi:conserved hypothetical protein [Theileria equi strain WA]|uniref:mTERF domain-containing protein 1, mitochondrial n=1 Tax=Theileria equi strain WA TaxID=1537102 RepID=L1LF20_THEEQ|nr:conserved hypothetical protein [Theileria equi strain WA]EKX73951.1 conserved hypothetical protein [Theileria equi strain WA]|eukprot:XP_004833403.1 conserved hypothetical protein [Theileria equi strain WA]